MRWSPRRLLGLLKSTSNCFKMHTAGYSLLLALFASVREAFGDCPRNEFSILTRELLERRQRAHDLTSAYKVHPCHTRSFDLHLCASTDRRPRPCYNI